MQNHDFCYVKMSDEDKKILKYIPGEKSFKAPYIICVDLECLLEKKKQMHVRIILKNLIQKRKLSIYL